MPEQPTATDQETEALTKYLYRYRSFPGDADLHQIEEIFTERKLFLSSPSAFNDPFDCRAEMIQLPKNHEEWRKAGLQTLKKQNPSMSRQQRRAHIRKYQKERVYEKVNKNGAFLKYMQTEMNGLGILCLSEVPDHILMWSHYTTGHTGFCLLFSRTNSFFLNAIPVHYSEGYPRFKAFQDPKDNQLDIVLRAKAKDWEYEKEWRLIRKNGANKTFVYPKGSLVGVILGCRMSEEHKRLLMTWTGAMTPRPMLIQARRKERKFGLDFFLMNPDTGKETPIDLNDLEVG